MQTFLIALLVGAAGGAVGGYILATHIHSVAAAAASAVARASTIPSGDVAKLNAAVSGLGDKIEANTAAVGAAAAGAVAKVG